MYRVYFDGILAGAPNGAGLDLIEPHLSLKENTAGKFTFTMSPRHPKYNSVYKNVTLIEVYLEDDENPTWRGYAQHITDNFMLFRTVECDGILTVLSQTIQYPAYHDGVTITQRLQTILANHNSQIRDNNKKFQLGNVALGNSTDKMYCFSNYNTSLEEIKSDILDDFGGFIRIRFDSGLNYIDLFADAPRECTQTVEFASNILDMQCDYEVNNLCTAVVPLGAILSEDNRTPDAITNLDEYLTIKNAAKNTNHNLYIASDTAIANYGWICKAVKFDQITTADNLYAKGEEYLHDNQFENIVVTVKAMDLSMKYKDFQKFELSDNVRAKSKPHGMDTTMRITQIDKYLNAMVQDTITLGSSSSQTLTRIVNGKSYKFKSSGSGFTNNIGGGTGSGGGTGGGTTAPTLSSVSAKYNGEAVPVGTRIESLRGDIVVTAKYSDGSYNVVTDYIMSYGDGTLIDGINIVNITYDGKGTTIGIEAYIPSTIVREITASYNGGTLYEGANIEYYREYITVTAIYSDGTTNVVTDYTLQGTISSGSNTITVEYGGKTTTFTVVANESDAKSLTAEAKYNASTYTLDFSIGGEVVEDFDPEWWACVPMMSAEPTSNPSVWQELATRPSMSLSGGKIVFSMVINNNTKYWGLRLKDSYNECTYAIIFEGKRSEFVDNATYVAKRGSTDSEYRIDPAVYTLPDATPVLHSITANYTGGSVSAGTSLDNLKSNLTVTAHMSDGSTQSVSSYTLSGTINVGANTITVTYSGKTTTFSVTGTEVVSAPFESSTGKFTYVSTTYVKSYTMTVGAVGDIVSGTSANDWVVEAVYRTNADSSATIYTDSTQQINATVNGKTVSATVSLANASRYYGIRLTNGNKQYLFLMNSTRSSYVNNQYYEFTFDAVTNRYYTP